MICMKKDTGSILFLALAGLGLYLVLSAPDNPLHARTKLVEPANRRESIQSPQEPTKHKAATEAESRLTEEQVKSLIEREFGGLFLVDGRVISPSHLVGDFNGDGVKDIVVLARPRSGIDPSDKSIPSFWLDAAVSGGKLPPRTRTRIRRKDYPPKYEFTIGDLARYRDTRLPILLIVHGAEGRLWNNSERQQRFVVLGGMDVDANRMQLYQGKLKPESLGDTGIADPPDLIGDGILFTYEGRGAIVYWEKDGYYTFPFNP